MGPRKFQEGAKRRSKIDFNLKNKILKRKNGSRCGLTKDENMKPKFRCKTDPEACRPDLAGNGKHVSLATEKRHAGNTARERERRKRGT